MSSDDVAVLNKPSNIIPERLHCSCHYTAWPVPDCLECVVFGMRSGEVIIYKFV